MTKSFEKVHVGLHCFYAYVCSRDLIAYASGLFHAEIKHVAVDGKKCVIEFGAYFFEIWGWTFAYVCGFPPVYGANRNFFVFGKLEVVYVPPTLFVEKCDVFFFDFL